MAEPPTVDLKKARLGKIIKFNGEIITPYRDDSFDLEHNVATKGGVRSKNDRRLATRFFEPGG